MWTETTKMFSETKQNKRIRVLKDEEYQQIYGLPTFSREEQEWFFELTQQELSVLDTAATTETKIDAILQLGYFKAKQSFFAWTFNSVQSDFDYIRHRYFDSVITTKATIGRKAKYNNQQWVLSLFGYALFSKEKHSERLSEKIHNTARLSTDPFFMFQEILTWFEENKLVLPGYTTLQDMISNALYAEQKRISSIINTQLTDVEISSVLQLLEQQEGHFRITSLKKEPKNFKPKAIYKEIENFNSYLSLYDIAKRVLPLLDISKKSMMYYASLAEHYTTQGLNRTKKLQSCLWLLCFIHYRYQRMCDNLVTMFIYIFNQYDKAIKESTQALLLAEALSEAAQKAVVAKLIRFYIDQDIDRTQPFSSIIEKAYSIIDPELIEQVATRYENHKFNEKFTWQSIDDLARTYNPLLRSLLRVLPFTSNKHRSLQLALTFIKTTVDDEQSLTKAPYKNFPKQIISASIKEHIIDEVEQMIQVGRYEYYCYSKVTCYLENKSLFITDSTKYRSLESELLPNWLHEKEAVLKKLSNPRLDQSVDQFIEEKAKPLDKKIIEINETIQNGQNPDVKIRTAKDGSIIWTLPYTKKDIELNNPFYEKIPTVSISQVLHLVNQHTRFIQQFTHIKPHKAKSQLDELCILANLIGKGTNLGSAKMAELCDLPQNELAASDQNFIRLATLRNANDVISNAIAALPIFRHWNFAANLLHASLDGQKFITEFDTLLSRYSPKYFGLMKGVVAYTLLANHIPLNVKIIGANEHESCHLFDLIYNNTSNVQPDIFSTDTEGSNQLNFLLLNLINKVFAPRYRSFSTKTESIISFSDPKKFEDLLIKPSSQLNVNRLLKQENNIQHILASLLIGETNQSNIISKLSCNAFSNQIKLALWDMNAVLMSDYLLDYISDVVVRQSVQGALNRGEAYHQLRRHISSIHGKNFRGTNDREISIWNECARLLANATIYFNASILTKLMDYNERQGDVAQVKLIKKFSPVAWTHINFYGRYDLSRNDSSIDLDKIIRQLSAKDMEVDYLHLLNNKPEIQVYAEI